MRNQSDGSIEREQAAWAAQSAAASRLRVEDLQRRVGLLESCVAALVARVDALEAAARHEEAEVYSPLLTMRASEVS